MNRRLEWALLLVAYNAGRLVRWLRGNEEYHVVERQATAPPPPTLEDELDDLVRQLNR